MVSSEPLLSQFYVRLGGSDASDDLNNAISRIEVENSLHLPDVATISIHDTELRWVDDREMTPGAEVEILSDAGDGESPLFSGEIVEIESEFGPSAVTLTIRAFDRLHRLARGYHVRSFQNVTHGDLVKKLADEVGLNAEVADTPTVYEYVFQNNETNLDFLSRRSANLGLLLYVVDKTLVCQPIQPGPPIAELEWGASLSVFRPMRTTLEHVSQIHVKGWDPESKQEIFGSAETVPGHPQIGYSGDGEQPGSEAFGISAHRLIEATTIRSQTEAEQHALAAADQAAGMFVQAEGTCSGDPAIRAGTTVSISAVGEQFSGEYFVTTTRHVYGADQGFSTEFSISGHQPMSILSLLSGSVESRGGMGLTIGVVTDNLDPGGIGRVKVKFPGLSNEHASHWARVVAPGAGHERGIQFLPEVNDEVLVGFEQGDVHHPYVIGGLWNGQDLPPLASQKTVEGGNVERRIIRSRSGHSIIFDDSSESGGISIVDRNDNRIVINSNSHQLDIEVRGDVHVRSSGNVSIESRGRLRLKGDAGVSVESPGPVEVQGAVVKLN